MPWTEKLKKNMQNESSRNMIQCLPIFLILIEYTLITNNTVLE